MPLRRTHAIPRYLVCSLVVLSCIIFLISPAGAQVILRDTVRINPPLPDIQEFLGLRVFVSPETVTVGQEVTVTVIGRDLEGGEFPLDGSTPINFFSMNLEFTAGTTIINVGHDTSIFSFLFDVPYRDTRAGNIRVIPEIRAFAIPFNRFRVLASVSGGISEPGEAFFTTYSPPQSGLDHFRVTLEPDTIRAGEVSTLTAIAEDAQNNEIALDTATLVIVDVTSPESGSIITPEGDTVLAPSHVFEYREVRDGLVRFFANQDVSDTQHVQLTVRKGDDETKRGTSSIIVIPIPIVLHMTADSTEVYPFGTGGNNSTRITVEATRRGLPVVGISISFEARAVDSSGGHSHHDNRPVGLLSSNQLQSGSDGKTSAIYIASNFGGVERIIASSGGRTIRDSVDVVVKVPYLRLLPDEPNLYVKTGGTCEHHGPSDRLPSDSPCKLPDNNHWGTEDVISAIFSIGFAWLFELPTEPPLFINDISLPHGGLFDVSGNWRPKHSGHRTGKDVDVRTEFPNPSDFRVGVSIRSPRNSLDVEDIVGSGLFEQTCMRWGARKIEIHGTLGTPNEHYHVYF